MNTENSGGNSARRAVVAMSGGVDSSVAAMLLAQSGAEVAGITFRLPYYGRPGDVSQGCCGVAGIEDARRVCRQLGIRHFVLDYRSVFEETVFDYFISEYAAGRTPNPCIRCNEWLKFGRLLDTARLMGSREVATGHYVRSNYDAAAERHELLRGLEGEDQSYFLFSLSQDQLAHASFPLGGLNKEQVRLRARRAGLKVHNSPKSQDLCFIPERSYAEILSVRRPEMFSPGELRHVCGRKLGRHSGIAYYTVGQRKGLGIAWKEPLYVVEIDAVNNIIMVGEKEYVQKRVVTVGELNWVSIAPPGRGDVRAGVKIRYRHRASPAVLHIRADGKAEVEFEEPQTAPTPGQAAVFYGGEKVLGGGFIE